jgi:chromosome segregation ATPase
MSPSELQLKRIQEKAQQLVKRYQQLQAENEQLKKEMRACAEKQELYKNRMETLEEKVAVLKTASGQLEPADKKEIEKKLNHYLKEIDRCITMLSE